MKIMRQQTTNNVRGKRQLTAGHHLDAMQMVLTGLCVHQGHVTIFTLGEMRRRRCRSETLPNSGARETGRVDKPVGTQLPRETQPRHWGCCSLWTFGEWRRMALLSEEESRMDRCLRKGNGKDHGWKALSMGSGSGGSLLPNASTCRSKRQLGCIAFAFRQKKKTLISHLHIATVTKFHIH